MKRGSAIALATMLALIPATALAQDTLFRPRDVIAGLKVNEYIRVELRDGRRETGLQRLSGNAVSLYSSFHSWRAIPTDSVSRVWRQQGSYWRESAVVFGLVGALFASFRNALCQDPDSGNHDHCLPALYALGSVSVGALLGALIGTGIPRWHPIYPSAQ